MSTTVPVPAYQLPTGYRHVYSGKVRELYETPDGHLLFVATDRISAYDWVLPTSIPDKGRVLTAMSLWWFERLADLVAHHVVSTEVPEVVAGRAFLARRLDMVPVECVARGYLAGSGLVEYAASRSVCGVDLPEGLVEGSRLPEPVFTPATKATLGEHDENVSLDRVAEQVGRELAERLRRTTLQVYARGHGLAEQRGILLADTKLEFGLDPQDGSLVLADEVLTPDSSRYWPAGSWRPGGPQPYYDKQYVRDWLVSPAARWSPSSGEAPPALPEEVVERTRQRYVAAYEALTGRRFA